MTTYRIQNAYGQWWGGACWGPREAAQDYAREDLPLCIGFLDLDDTTGGNPGYYREGATSPEALARIE